MTKSRLASAVLTVLCLSAAAGAADWKAENGYNSLKAELQAIGATVPSGVGVGVSHIEADVDDNPANGLQYLVDTTLAEFSGKTVTALSGPGSVSWHGNIVGQYYYGQNTSMAHNVMLIDAYEANAWLGAGLMRTLDANPPKIESRQVQNHSWIGELGTDADTADVLRRIDLLVDRDGTVVCAGVNNYNLVYPATSSRAMPKLLCSAYNVIAVGLSSATSETSGSSFGPTLIEAPGRVKPDIVASAADGAMYTSFATPVVASAAAMLLEAADTIQALDYVHPRERSSAEALLTKALLMGGASKTGLDGWRRGFATPSDDGTVPLDYRYGAGDLNVYNSYHILTAGRRAASWTVLLPPTGWDFSTIAAGETRYYFFQVPDGQVARTLSILLTWNRKIVAPPDFDRDDDVDRDDLAIFQSCVTGPSSGPVPAGCAQMDFDHDGDVDQSDFGVFQTCISGPQELPNVSCRGGLTPVLADLDLRLYAANGFAPTTQRDLSISAVDNVEHIYIENLAAGTWAIAVNSDQTWPYAITWDAKLAPAE